MKRGAVRLWLAWIGFLTVLMATRFLGGTSWGWTALLSKIPEPIPLLVTVLFGLASLRVVRRAPMWFICSALLSLAILQPSFGRGQAVRDGDIKVLQYNIQHGMGRIVSVAEVIRREDADLVFLEETGPLDQLPANRNLDLDRALDPYRIVRRKFEAIGVRGIVTSHRFIDLASMPGEQKLATVVDATVRGTDLCLIVVHLSPMQIEQQPLDEWPSYLRKYSEVHRGQIDVLCELVESASRPVVLAGDFNLYATGPWHRRLSSVARDTHRDVALGLGYTMPTSFPVERIDYVWSKGLLPIGLAVLPDRGSDHLPVVAWLRPRGYNSR